MPLADLGWLAACFSAIFFVVDPFAVVPLFIAMTPGDASEKRRRMATRASLVAGGILVAFALGGQVVFHLLGITLPAFRIAGGLLLVITALEELQSKSPAATRTTGAEIEEGTAKDDIAIVPLAMPLLAGPGAIATVMVLASEAKALWQTAGLVASIALTALASWLLLRAAERVDRAMGPTARAILVRVTGLLLAAIGVQFILSGVLEVFPNLAK